MIIYTLWNCNGSQDASQNNYIYCETAMEVRIQVKIVRLTLYRAASDPTYLERGGRNQPAPQFSARGAPIGQIMIPPQTFSVNVVYKKRIGSIGQKLGPWPQFENFRNWPIWPKDRFSRISFRPYKNWHSSVIFGPIDPIFFCKCKLRPISMWW